jgi:hypothetical protein
MMRELTPLTCLAILTFEAPTAAACPNDEHSQAHRRHRGAQTPKAAGAAHDRPPAPHRETPSTWRRPAKKPRSTWPKRCSADQGGGGVMGEVVGEVVGEAIG